MTVRQEPVLWASLASVATVAVLVIGIAALTETDDLRQIVSWIEARGGAAPVLFILVMAACVLLVLPGVVLTTGAGFLFGTLAGTAVVVIGTTLGATAAFLAARYTPPGRILGQRAKALALSRRGLHLINDEFGRNGWKIILVSRLVPFFPGKLSNYVFGLMPVSLSGFIGGTFAGVIPFSLHNAYLGSLAGSALGQDMTRGPQSPVEWMIYGLGFVCLVVTVIYISRLARRTLRGFTKSNGRTAGKCRG